MFGAAGVWEPGAGVRIGCWRPHARFRAFSCPPARGVPLRIAHLHAAASHLRFRTMAVAPTCRNTRQQSRSVGEERERGLQENESHEAEPAQSASPRDGLTEEPAHGAILRTTWEKPIAPGVRKFCYQGPGTTLKRRRLKMTGGGGFPIQTADSSESDQEYRFGADEAPFSEAKLKIMGCLSKYKANSTWREPCTRGLRGRVSDDEM
jgi:hypothetical protein